METEIRKIRNEQNKKRLEDLLKAYPGASVYDLSRLSLVSPSTIYRWLKKYNQEKRYAMFLKK